MNHRKTVQRIAMLLLILIAAGRCLAADKVVVVEDGKSEYCIYHTDTAPGSVKLAAEELQRYIEKTTKVKLPIVTSLPSPLTGKVIRLGGGAQLKNSQHPFNGLIPEGYKITVDNGDINIFGIDTPDGEKSNNGGFSRGTLNGVYSFIEKFLGVRWLMPGANGEYCPSKQSLSVPTTEIIENPSFLNRRIPYIGKKTKKLKRWMLRNKLGYSLFLQHNHNWERLLPRDRFAAHPEYFAERGGKRAKPVNERYKICTSNKDVIRICADKCVTVFQKDPKRTCYSLSPSDSMGYCQCRDCRALDETAPDGKKRITRRILSFYNDIATIVGKQYPDKFLGGYVYQAYELPPIDKKIKSRKNVFLVWAPLFNYGMTHFRPEVREKWNKTLDGWRNVSENLAYYDLCNVVTQSTAAPNPPCRKILKSIFPALKKAKIKGVYMYGTPTWGHGACLNYALAKLCWNADADVDGIVDEFYNMSYGAAGSDIKKMYDMIETALEKYYIENPDAGYRLQSTALRKVYAANFAKIEKLYAAADGKSLSAEERFRLERLGDCLKVLHRDLSAFGWLSDHQKSRFYLSPEAYLRFVNARKGSIFIPRVKGMGITPAMKASLKKSYLVKLPKTLPANITPAKKYYLRKSQHVIMRASTETDVIIDIAIQRSANSTYAICDSMGKITSKGFLGNKKTVTFFAQGKEVYHLFITTGGMLSLKISNAAYAIDSRYAGKTSLHLWNKTTPLYFYVPRDSRKFSLTLNSSAPGETAAATLFDPENNEVARFETVSSPVDDKTIDCSKRKSGLWKISVGKASKGILDDVWLSTGDGLSGFFSPNPKNILIIKNKSIK